MVETFKDGVKMQVPIPDDIVCLTVISVREDKEDLMDAMSDGGGKLINVEFAWGSAHVSSLSEMFGFTPDDKKVVLTCLMKKDKSEEFLDLLANEFEFDKPNTGIAFTIPLDKLSF